MNESHDLRLGKSVFAVLRTRLIYALGKFVGYPTKARWLYESVNSERYNFQGNRQSSERIVALNRYVAEQGPLYRATLAKLSKSQKIDDTSQYYVYKWAESHLTGPNPVICDIGAFYVAAGCRFLEKHSDGTVYAIDFGDMETLNADLKNDRLKIFSGYPLEILEKFVAEGKRDMFDFVVFSRTATLMTAAELMSYMACIKQLSKAVAFLEVAKTTSQMTTSLDIAQLPVDKPARIFNGMYIHNYPAVLKQFGFKVTASKVLPHTAFVGAGEKESFVPDHYFQFAAGERE